jgi:hypothetical protein
MHYLQLPTTHRFTLGEIAGAATNKLGLTSVSGRLKTAAMHHHELQIRGSGYINFIHYSL